MDHNMDPTTTDFPTPPLVMRIRDALGSESPQARGEQKLAAALQWLFSFHKTSPGILRQVVGVQAAGYARQLQRRGLVEIYQTTSLRGGLVVMLTTTGVALAEGLLPEFAGRYDPRWSSVRPQLLVHDLACQVALLSIRRKTKVYRYLPEHLAGLADTTGVKRADIMVWLTPDTPGQLWTPWGIEVERTAKRIGQELDTTLVRAARAVERNRVVGQIFVFINEPVLRLYQTTLAKPLPLWEKDRVSGCLLYTSDAADE